MPIKYNKNSREFHLYNNSISYIVNILKNDQIGNLYFGKKVRERESYKHLNTSKQRGSTVAYYKDDNTFSLDLIQQEYPSYGKTDFREPAFQIRQENGSRITEFKYKSHKIYSGKPKLKGLPATYVENDNEAVTLEIILEDSVIETELILIYTIYENYNAITRSSRFINNGNQQLYLKRAMSMNLDLPDSKFEIMQLSGAWARECHLKTRKLEVGIQSVSSTRVASSAYHNPFIALKRWNTTENSGEVYGFSFVYSGNFLAQVEVDFDNVSRVSLGINPFDFEWLLGQNEAFQTPEVVMVYSDSGINNMSQTYHKLYGKRLIRGEFRDGIRPILINNWEATYFTFDEKVLFEIAENAKKIGIELFVVDDGWFGKRDDDKHSLGDWYVNKEKIPSGIDGLSKKIADMGMKFGLWFEPEMVSENSELYKKHTDWIIKVPNRNPSYGRNQFVLDFSRKDVVDYIHMMIRDVLKSSKISYIKWDMNRYITELGSQKLPAERQGEVAHRYILGLYELYERLTSEFPEILFESCAGGGGRFDPGMLYYAPQTWTSDDTDAIERLKIQYGTSIVYPLYSMGTHISQVPNHQVGRNTPLDTRANVAYFGTFGYELNLSELNQEEIEKVKGQIRFYKQNRELIKNGDFYRLISPFSENETAWMVVSEDKTEALFGYYEILGKPNSGKKIIKLVGLVEDKEYEIKGFERSYYGDELMNIGFIIEECNFGNMGDFYSRVFVIQER